MNQDLEELAAIIEQLDKTEFTDFRYENGGLKIQVRRGGYFADGPASPDGTATAPAPAATPTPAPAPAATPTPAPAPAEPATTLADPQAQPAPAAAAPVTAPDAPAGASANGLSPENLPEGYVAVSAPMLGSFYSSPKPGEPPFVKLGDAVETDSVVCIVEVMKLMNSVPAGAAGEVAAVFASDGELVEYGQPLFALKVAA